MSYSKNNQARKIYSSDEESTSETTAKIKSHLETTPVFAKPTTTEKKSKSFDDKLLQSEKQNAEIYKESHTQQQNSLKSLLRFNILSGICGRRSYGHIQHSTKENLIPIASTDKNNPYTGSSNLIIPAATVISLINTNAQIDQHHTTTTASTTPSKSITSTISTNLEYVTKPSTHYHSNDLDTTAALTQRHQSHQHCHHNFATNHKQYHQHQQYSQEKDNIATLTNDYIYDADIADTSKDFQACHQQEFNKRRCLILTRSLFDVSAAAQVSRNSIYSTNKNNIVTSLQQKPFEQRKISIYDQYNRRLRHERHETGISAKKFTSHDQPSEYGPQNFVNFREAVPVHNTSVHEEKFLNTTTAAGSPSKTTARQSHISTYKSYLESTSSRWLKAASLGATNYTALRSSTTAAAVASATAAYHFQKQQEPSALFYLTAAPHILAAVAQQHHSLDVDDARKNHVISKRLSQDSLPTLFYTSQSTESYDVTTNSTPFPTLTRQQPFDDDEELYFNEGDICVYKSHNQDACRRRNLVRLEHQQESQSRSRLSTLSSSTTHSERYSTAIGSESSVYFWHNVDDDQNHFESSSNSSEHDNIASKERRDQLFLEFSACYDQTLTHLLNPTSNIDRFAAKNDCSCAELTMLQQSFPQTQQSQQSATNIDNTHSETFTALNDTKSAKKPSGLHLIASPLCTLKNETLELSIRLPVNNINSKSKSNSSSPASGGNYNISSQSLQSVQHSQQTNLNKLNNNSSSTSDNAFVPVGTTQNNNINTMVGTQQHHRYHHHIHPLHRTQHVSATNDDTTSLTDATDITNTTRSIATFTGDLHIPCNVTKSQSSQGNCQHLYHQHQNSLHSPSNSTWGEVYISRTQQENTNFLRTSIMATNSKVAADSSTKINYWKPKLTLNVL